MSQPGVGYRRAREATLGMDPRIWDRREEVLRRARNRRLAASVVAVSFAVMSMLLLALLHSPAFEVARVRLSGASRTTTGQVYQAAGLVGHVPMIDVSAGRAEDALEALPWARQAVVSIEWPATIAIRITEWRPVAWAASASSPGREVLLAGQGRVLALTTAVPPGLFHLVGLSIAEQPGQDVPAMATGPLRVAAALASAGQQAPGQQIVSLAGSVSSVTGQLSGGAEVIFGRAANLHAKVGALETMLAHLPPGPLKVLDVSIPSAPTLTP
ncbi:MAG: cell division protein FtsQ/DivIB [Acidimicrobiales bacterium]